MLENEETSESSRRQDTISIHHMIFRLNVIQPGIVVLAGKAFIPPHRIMTRCGVIDCSLGAAIVTYFQNGKPYISIQLPSFESEIGSHMDLAVKACREVTKQLADLGWVFSSRISQGNLSTTESCKGFEVENTSSPDFIKELLSKPGSLNNSKLVIKVSMGWEGDECKFSPSLTKGE